MIVAAVLLIVLGLVVAMLGFKLFRIILPLLGFVAGLMVGFGGFQGVFGKGAVSTTIAIMVAVIVGVLLAVLSYAFFEIALIVIAIIVGASAMSFLGVALGLNQDGFVVFMLALAGGILAGIFSVRYPLGTSFVTLLTSLAGMAVFLAGIMLVVGDVSLEDLNTNGVIPTVLDVVDQSFLWFLVWIGASLVALQIQLKSLMLEFANDVYEFKPKQ